MLHGKHTCEQLKAIRQQIADANGIDYMPAQCTHDGPCRGTCPNCEAEKSYLEQQLSLKAKAGQAIKIIGVAASLVASASAQQLSAQEEADSTVADTSLEWAASYDNLSGIAPHPAYYNQLVEMAEFVDEYPDRLYLMIGHTDERGSVDYNLKLSLKRAEYMAAIVKDESKSKGVNIVPVGLAYFSPAISGAKDEAEHEQNRRASLETYNPNKYHGQSAAFVELAIYKSMFPTNTEQIQKWENAIETLRKKRKSDKLTANYDSLAQEIHSAWSK